MTRTFQSLIGYLEIILSVLNFEFWSPVLRSSLLRRMDLYLSFDFAQDGEPVEPFDIWFLVLGIFMIFIEQVSSPTSVNYLFK